VTEAAPAPGPAAGSRVAEEGGALAGNGATRERVEAMTKELPGLLATRVVGSYSVPEWLGRLKTDRGRGRISPTYLDEVHEVVIKAAVKDQETAGIDIVSDGELRRDNEVDYLLERLPGVEVLSSQKTYYYDYDQAVVHRPLPDGSLGRLGELVEDFTFVRSLTDRPVAISLTGPFSLSRRLHNEAYHDEDDLVLAVARALHEAAVELVQAGAVYLQIDEPFLAGYPEAAGLAVRAINTITEGVDAHWAAHVCYGNRYARPAWEGHYDFLFPAFLDARIDQLLLEFARKGDDDLELFGRYPSDLVVGVGVIDVKSNEIEPPSMVAARLEHALKVVPPERVAVNPDCGLRHLSPRVAGQKLRSMTAAAALVRAELLGTPFEATDASDGSPESPGAEQETDQRNEEAERDQREETRHGHA
jgi:5-methyltetrahydropteroyltriglutamate--homocysteine methyltransferase